MSQYFPKLFRRFGGNVNVKVDLSNYATKTNLKNVTYVDTSSFALKTNLASLKRSQKYFVLKTKYQTEKAELEKEIPAVTNLVKKQN